VSFIAVVLALALQGLLVGAFARLALPGRDPMSLFETMGFGLAGSFVAGLLTYAVSDGRAAPSFLAALVFSVGIVYLIRRRRGGGLMRPSGEVGPGDGPGARRY
jgi:uncharacterized membrane protein YeaQ/YmgE (transglycosylase-associated protein family)